MIKVIINNQKSLEQVIIQGHADYEDFGKDIVCAACSSIVTTSVNAMIRIDESAISYEEENGIIIKVLKHTNEIDKLMENMVDLLEQLENQYPKNIKLRRC